MKSNQASRSQYIENLMRNSPVARNQIAAISGLSNPYIRDLEAGSIANVGREKLISLAIALDLSLNEIDRMLTVFDRAQLSHDDISSFIRATQRCRISAALHPVQDSFTLDLLLLAAEQKFGPHVIVSPRPASCLRAEGHRWYAEKTLVETHAIYGDLVAAIIKERRHQLLVNLNSHAVEQYVCKQCLEDYISHCNDSVEKKWRVEHLKNAINLIRNFENFNFYLVDECPSFIFVLKTQISPDVRSEKLILTALPPHRMQIRTSGWLAGFATDSQAVISNFKKELELIKTTVHDVYLERDRLVAFLQNLTQ